MMRDSSSPSGNKSNAFCRETLRCPFFRDKGIVGEEVVEDGSLAIRLLVIDEVCLNLIDFFADHLDIS